MESQKKRVKYHSVTALYLLLAFFAVPHLIDDFLFGVPEEFGLSNITAQILSGIFIVIYLGVLVLLVQGKKGGLFSAMAMGAFLALAGILKHIPLMLEPGPYWSGWFSEILIIGLILAGAAVFAAGFFFIKR